MKIKTTILSIVVSITAIGCSPRSYVMSFQPTSGGDNKYSVPQSLNPESTTPSEVSSPTMPSKAQKVERPVRGDDSALQASNSSDIDAYVGAEAVGGSAFVGNEAEHVKFSNYNPFTDGVLSIDLDDAAVGFTYPVDGKFSSGYGRRGRGTHAGVDLVAPSLTPIYAAFDGVVRLSKPYSGYGNMIVIRHNNGLETLYAHNTKNLVQAGQNVKSGEVIATCGRTGRATTNHLHFEVRVIGQTINPSLLIDVDDKKLQRGVLKITKNSNGGITAKLTRGQNTTEPTPVVANVETKTKVEPEKVSAVEKTEKVVEHKPTAPASPSQSKGMRVGDKVYDAPAPTAKYHTIASGDMLYTIARKYNTTVAELCRLNSITKDTVIKTGKKLRVK